MDRVVVVDHPLVQHKLTLMRMEQRSTKGFRQLLNEIGMLLLLRGDARSAGRTRRNRDPPSPRCLHPRIAGKKLVFAPILRAGVGFLDGMLDLVPSARVAHIGLYRDPVTLQAVEYYFKAPVDIADRLTIVMDPMLATANSAIAAIDLLKKRGAQDLRFVCLLAGARRRRQAARGSPGGVDLDRGHRRKARPSRLYRARTRRRRRSDVRDQIEAARGSVHGEDVGRGGPPDGAGGPGLRTTASWPRCRCGSSRPHSRPIGAAPDRQRQRAGASPLPPGLLAPRQLRPRLDRPRRLGTETGAAALRILGPRGLSAPGGALSTLSLAHGAGRTRRHRLRGSPRLRPRRPGRRRCRAASDRG